MIEKIVEQFFVVTLQDKVGKNSHPHRPSRPGVPLPLMYMFIEVKRSCPIP